MMGVAAFAKSRVVVGGNGVYHILVHLIVLGQGQAAFDDLLGVVALMGRVEMVVAGQDLLFDVGFYFLSYHFFKIVGLSYHGSPTSQLFVFCHYCAVKLKA